MTPWRDATTHLVMSPLEFMQRLAALVPRPRLHLIRFHGVQAKPAEREVNCARHQPVRLSWAKLLKRVFEIDPERCPKCGGELRIIAATLEQLSIARPGDTSCVARLHLGIAGGVEAAQVSGLTRREPA